MQFRNLVFEGGGVKGIAYAGAMKVLEEEGVIPEVKRTAGTSAGAITAALIAAGANWTQVRDIVGGTSFRKFMDDSFGVLRDINRLVNEFGWFKGDMFSKWFRKQIAHLTGKKDLTFGQLADMHEKEPQKFKLLSMVGTNLTLQAPEIYSADTTPDMPVWKAVRISMSIPMFFAAIRDTDDDVLVDGGVTWNFPLDMFDRKSCLDDSGSFAPVDYPTMRFPDQIFNKETLGFRVDTRDEIRAAQKRELLPPKEIEDIVDYLKAVIGFMNDMANKAHLHKNDWDRTVFIDALGIGTTQFDLSDQEVNDLINSGVEWTRKYFHWFRTVSPPPLNKV